MDVPIIIAAHKRPHSFHRLIKSLLNAHYRVKVKLYISIDGGSDPEVREIAESLEWPFGDKEVIVHPANLGLKNHIFFCSDLSLKHDAITILEDDLYVSPNFYEYTIQAVKFYKNDEKISGISLYTHSFNETAEMPFTSLNDGSSVFFLQLASSWGQCFSREQWSGFKSWYSNNKQLSRSQLSLLPSNVAKWPESSWKKYFICYMNENDLYFVYPRHSYCTNFADKGVNLNDDDHFQVPLCYGKETLSFPKFSESVAKYDSYCEILPSGINALVHTFSKFDFTVDLYGQKTFEAITTPFLLTSRPCLNPVKSFARKMIPHEANVISGISGNEIFFAHIDGVKRDTLRHSTRNLVYFHKLPRWHLKVKKSVNGKPVVMTDLEEILLKIYSTKLGKLLLLPLFYLHKIYTKIPFKR